jgi:phytoene desaturase
VAESLGVEFRFDSEVIRLSTASDGRVREVFYRSGPTERTLRADIVVANADYPHVELDLLDSSVRSKDSGFWNRKTYAPGVLNFYLGVDHPLPNLEHHTFFFDSDWHEHFDSVYGSPKWPADPLFYLHIPSKTDPNCAPTGREAVFILVPIAMGLDDPSELRERYFTRVSERIRELAGEDVSSGLDFRESMSISEFQTDYNAYGGTAFGLGQTLFQTAVFRPGNRSPKVPNLYFAGHYTVPGTGTTMSMISGAVVAKRIREDAPA